MGAIRAEGGVGYFFSDRFSDAFELASLPFKGPDFGLGMNLEASSMATTVARYIPQTPIINER